MKYYFNVYSHKKLQQSFVQTVVHMIDKLIFFIFVGAFNDAYLTHPLSFIAGLWTDPLASLSSSLSWCSFFMSSFGVVKWTIIYYLFHAFFSKVFFRESFLSSKSHDVQSTNTRVSFHNVSICKKIPNKCKIFTDRL